MLVDVFRRDEGNGKFSHLAVPVGKDIPQEATNWDWHDEARGVLLDEFAARWAQFGIESPGEQIKKKGYAITSVSEQTD